MSEFESCVDSLSRKEKTFAEALRSYTTRLIGKGKPYSSQKALADELGIPLRTIENYLGSKSTPKPFMQRALLEELERLCCLHGVD